MKEMNAQAPCPTCGALQSRVRITPVSRVVADEIGGLLAQRAALVSALKAFVSAADQTTASPDFVYPLLEQATDQGKQALRDAGEE